MRNLFYFLFFIGAIGSSILIPQNTEAACTIKSATFSPSGIKDTSSQKFFRESNPPAVFVGIETDGCNGEKLFVSIQSVIENGVDEDVADFTNKEVTVTQSEFVGFYTRAGEDSCYQSTNDPECTYYILIEEDDLVGTDKYSSYSKTNGQISYDCDGVCSADWIIEATVYEKPIPQPESPIQLTGNGNATQTECGTDPNCYALLEPLPGLKKVDSSVKISDYLNIIFKLGIGIISVLAVIMIIAGGVQYMSSDAITNKEEGISKVTNAVLGLLIALSIFTILNTINPNLLDLEPGIKKITLTADEKTFADTEEAITPQSMGYKLQGTYQAPSPGSAISAFKNNYLANGYEIKEIKVNTSSKKATFVATKGGDTQTVDTPINIGANGVANEGQGVGGDKKTPRGTTTIKIDRNPHISVSNLKAILTRDGKYNLGAVFINIGATYQGQDRGIGLHGHANNTLGTTNGCIRMYNDVLLVLAPYIKDGTKVVIQ